MHDLRTFGLGDMADCCTWLRAASQDVASMEDAAQRIASLLHERLLEDGSDRRQTALVRVYKTHPLGMLEPDLRESARRSVEGEAGDGVPCLTLLGTRGLEPEWNDRRASRGHRAIPLASERVMSSLPMIDRLVHDLGLLPADVVAPTASLMLQDSTRRCNVFYVEEALGSPWIPAQEGFVVPYGIRTVIGFGGLLPDGCLYAVILFLTTHVPRDTAEQMRPLSHAVKLALLPFVGGPVFRGDPAARTTGPRDAEAEAATLRDLIGVYEDTVRERSADLREAHQRLEERTQILHSVLQHMGSGVVVTDESGAPTLVNPAAARLLGSEGARLPLQRWCQALRTTRPDGEPHQDETFPLSPLLRRSPVDGVLLSIDGEGGERRLIEVNGRPLLDSATGGAVLVINDVTERRRVERMKDEFISMVSHELRTPLTSIRGALGLLSGGIVGDMPEQARKMVTLAISNTDRLTRLINDILDIERIESGQASLEMRACEASDLVRAAVDAVRSLSQGSSVTMEVEASDARAWADPDRVVQVLVNLLGNAVKFSEAGTVVRVRAASEGGMVRFDVRDEGRGIPSDRQESIFDRFVQVDASDSRQKGGTGLGLAISRGIVQQHGGRIWVRSAPGSGSTFSFTVPALRGPSSRHPAARVMLCGGEASDRMHARPHLERLGYDVLEVASQAEAMTVVESMGVQAVLLCLGTQQWEDCEFLFAHPHEPSGSGGRSARRVLIVEDDEDLSLLLQQMFQVHGLATEVAASGRAAMALAEREPPDLMVLDLMLPDLDGFGVVDWLRENGRLARIPLLVYTALDLERSDRARLQLGATRIFTKGRTSPQSVVDAALDLLSMVLDVEGQAPMEPTVP